MPGPIPFPYPDRPGKQDSATHYADIARYPSIVTRRRQDIMMWPRVEDAKPLLPKMHHISGITRSGRLIHPIRIRAAPIHGCPSQVTAYLLAQFQFPVSFRGQTIPSNRNSTYLSGRPGWVRSADRRKSVPQGILSTALRSHLIHGGSTAASLPQTPANRTHPEPFDVPAMALSKRHFL
jgi:hypothetical protein